MTGVQTCALPICRHGSMAVMEGLVVGGGDSICSQRVSCWRTWVLVGACRRGSMAVVEGRLVGGGDSSCSQRVLGYMGAGGHLAPCVDGCGGRAHGRSSWVMRTRRAASMCRVGRTWLLVGAHRRVSMLRSNLVPVQQGACQASRWGASACRRAPKGAGRGFLMMLLDAGTVRRQSWWWVLLNGGDRSWRFVGDGGGPLSPFVDGGGACCGCHRRC